MGVWYPPTVSKSSSEAVSELARQHPRSRHSRTGAALGRGSRDAMREFIDFVGQDPLIAFHAPFDRTFLARAVKKYVDRTFDNPWLDLAELAPALDPDAGMISLDEWLQRYGISVATRHNAAADAFATALFVARLLPEAKRQGAGDYFAMRRLTGHARWLR